MEHIKQGPFPESEEMKTSRPGGKDIHDWSASQIVEEILKDAVDKRASDILVEPIEGNVRIRFRIDGLLYEFDSFSFDLLPFIITRIKVLASLDIAEHRLPQDGRFKAAFGEKDNIDEVDFRVSTLPTSLGEKVVLRVLNRSAINLDIDKLGFDEHSLSLFRNNLKKPHGMILVCGPTGCGKTTTLYACLKYVDTVESNLMTVEDPVEFRLFGINQIAVHPAIGLTFASVLRSMLRQDPDVIMVGEMRDLETADIAVKAALTGHLVLSTLHTTTATGALIRFINMGIEPFLVASSCLVAASQILLRKICDKCAVRVELEPFQLKEFTEMGFSISKDTPILQSQGCPQCANTGFKGRAGIMEAFELTPEIREVVMRSATDAELREAAAKQGMKSLRYQAVQHVIEGKTSLAEAYRVTSVL